MLQTSVLNLGGSKGVKMGLNLFGTNILQVCNRSECVADQCFGSGRIQGGKMGLDSIDIGILEVCKRLECVADGCLIQLLVFCGSSSR